MEELCKEEKLLRKDGAEYYPGDMVIATHTFQGYGYNICYRTVESGTVGVVIHNSFYNPHIPNLHGCIRFFGSDRPVWVHSNDIQPDPSDYRFVG